MLFGFMCDAHDTAEGAKQINRAIDGTDLLNGYALVKLVHGGFVCLVGLLQGDIQNRTTSSTFTMPAESELS